MNRPTRRRTALGAATLATTLAIGLSACSVDATSSADPAASETAAPVAGGTLTVDFWPDNPAFACVDPFQTYWIEHRQVIRNLADSLTDQDPKTGEIKPWLATSWEVAPDGRQYTFHLRDGVTFSDGTPLDATAVQTSFDADKALLSTLPTAYGAVYIAGYDHTEVVDPSTVKVVFSTPNAAFLQGTSTTNLAILSPASYTSTPQERCAGKYVGSGPFTLEHYTPGESLKIVKRPGYAWASELNAHQGEAYLDAVEISYVAEDSVRVGNLLSGASSIDWPRNPFTDADIAQVTASGDTVESRSLPGPSSALYPNVSAGHPLSDLLVRQALQKSIDRTTYAKTVFGADYPVVEGAFDTTTPYFSSQQQALALDLDGAGKLLDRAGWKLGADGYREKDGQVLTLVDPITAQTPGDVLLQDQLKQAGFKVDLRVVTAADRVALLASGDYDLINTYYTRADPGVLQWILDPRVAGSKGLAVNAATPADLVQLQTWFDQGIAETDTTKRAAIYDQLQSFLVDQGISFPIFERVQQAGVDKAVHGFRFTSESFLSYYDIWLK